FVTENQSVANWTRLIAVEIRRDGTSLSEYERRETNTLRATCQGAQIYPRDPVTVSGLPASRFFTRVTQCAGSTQPESALYLVIQGKDALYAIHLAWRPYPPTENELQAALAFPAQRRQADAGSRGGDPRQESSGRAGAHEVAQSLSLRDEGERWPGTAGRPSRRRRKRPSASSTRPARRYELSSVCSKTSRWARLPPTRTISSKTGWMRRIASA